MTRKKDKNAVCGASMTRDGTLFSPSPLCARCAGIEQADATLLLRMFAPKLRALRAVRGRRVSTLVKEKDQRMKDARCGEEGDSQTREAQKPVVDFFFFFCCSLGNGIVAFASAAQSRSVVPSCDYSIPVAHPCRDRKRTERGWPSVVDYDASRIQDRAMWCVLTRNRETGM